jgi:hypothetical protein
VKHRKFGINDELIISLYIVIFSLVLKTALKLAFAEGEDFICNRFECEKNTRAVWLHAFELKVTHIEFLGSGFGKGSLGASSNLLDSTRAVRKLQLVS